MTPHVISHESFDKLKLILIRSFIIWRLCYKNIYSRIIIIEIGLEQATFIFFNLFFSAFEHVKSLLIMGPNNTKTHH
jgi:hypothetical protein